MRVFTLCVSIIMSFVLKKYLQKILWDANVISYFYSAYFRLFFPSFLNPQNAYELINLFGQRKIIDYKHN